MGFAVLILGKSGSGKSASMRHMKGLGLINVIGKPLPFKNDIPFVETDDYTKVKKMLFEAKRKSLVIDDAGYLLTNEFMRRSNEKGYEKFSEIGNHFWDLIRFISKELPNDKIVYMTMHEDENEFGNIIPKSIGKLLTEKVSIEGMFTIVLRSMREEGKYIFRTQSNGFDCAKSPIGMFAGESIENDLKVVDDTIRAYYNIDTHTAPSPTTATTQATTQVTTQVTTQKEDNNA